MRLRSKEVFDEIILILVIGGPGFHPTDTLPSTPLNTIFTSRSALDESTIAQSDDHAVIGNQVLDGNLPFVGKNRATAWCRVFLFNLKKLVLDDRQNTLFLGQDIEKVFNLLNDGIIFGFNLILLHRSELVKSQLKNGVHLSVSENILIPNDTRLAPNQDAQNLGRR